MDELDGLSLVVDHDTLQNRQKGSDPGLEGLCTLVLEEEGIQYKMIRVLAM